MGFFDDIFGGSSAKKAATAQADAQHRAIEQGRAAKKAGFDEAQGFYDQSYNALMPDAQAGYDAYQGMLGLRGMPQAQEEYQRFQDNPFWQIPQSTQDRGAEMLARNFDGLRSGAAAVALERYQGDTQYRRQQDYLNRFAGIGDNFQNLRLGYGQTQANTAVGKAGADFDASIANGNNIAAMIGARQQAKQAGQQNVMGAIQSGIALAAAPFTGGASLGMAGRGLGSMGGGGGSNALMGHLTTTGRTISGAPGGTYAPGLPWGTYS
jgi:hypothetical protein